MNWLKHMLSEIGDELKKIVGFVESPTLQADAEEVAALVLKAAPIVAKIASEVPNKTVEEVAAAYTNYGVPVATIENNATSIGNALLNLATFLLKALSPNSTVTKLNTAVQLALLSSAKPAAQ